MAREMPNARRRTRRLGCPAPHLAEPCPSLANPNPVYDFRAGSFT
jgi:hypothetical protein